MQKRIWKDKLSDEQGSGTLSALALIGVILMILGGFVAFQSIYLAKTRAQMIAEFAALNAASEERFDADSCKRASEVAVQNGEKFAKCEVLPGRNGDVKITVNSQRIPLISASAIAGPSEKGCG